MFLILLPYAHNKTTEEKDTILLQEKKLASAEPVSRLFDWRLFLLVYINSAILLDTTGARSQPSQGAWTSNASD